MWSTSTHYHSLLPPPSDFYTYSSRFPPLCLLPTHTQISLTNPINTTFATCTSMAAAIAVPCSSRTFRLGRMPFLGRKPTSITCQFPSSTRNFDPLVRFRRRPSFTVCFVAGDQKFDTKSADSNTSPGPSGEDSEEETIPVILTSNRELMIQEKMARKKSERITYLIAAIMSTFGITSMAVMAVYYRFSWQMEGGDVPYIEMFGTFALSVGAAVGMEYWARWAHEALWHASLWHMHESHHKPRDGPFELNDVFAIINAVPAIALLSYGFFHKGIFPGLCFGAGLGITVFGMAYMFVHDGLVHKRFQVGPIANVPYLRRVAAAHQGLLYGGNDTLWESTGLKGRSSVREVDLRSGKIKALQNMDDSYFGEGLTLLGQRLYQVTWLGKTGFIYDRYNLSKFKKFTHNMKDGWGLATDGKLLYGSDGSSSLYQINPKTMKVIAEHVVKYKGQEVYNLNELEYINNEVWANIWQSDCIARISPVDGTVIGWILLPELREGLVAAGNRIDVLNGIAWDEDKKRLFVTGKLWPKLYEIKLQPLRKPLRVPIERLCLRDPIHF